VYAQTAEEEYRAGLFRLIATLQQQITALQLQLETQSVVDSLAMLDSIQAVVVASYTVDQQKISTRAPQAYEDYFERLLTILPDQYDDHIDELVIFTKGREEVGAYVETRTPYTLDWRYSVRKSEVTEDPNSKASTELMVHEFAHILSLDQVFRERATARDCHPYFTDTLCYGSDSYLGQFIGTFWSNQMLDDLQSAQSGSRFDQADFYDRYESQFVSEYAATDPAEDFAESFTQYVYGEMAPRGSIADQKIEFFDQFRYIQELSDTIQQEL
jgi:Mlc titration factor MtfA (ptsG expression regulator)